MHFQLRDNGAYIRVRVLNINPRLGDVEPTVASVKAKMEAERGGVWVVHECYGNRRSFGGYDWTCDARKAA